MNLLHIVASPRGEQSRSLAISNAFLKVLGEKRPAIEIDTLDLFQIDLPEVFNGAVGAKYNWLSGNELEEQEELAWQKIGNHAKRFLDNDLYLVTCPMWNFSVPYRLKHYLDLIIQPGHMFTFSENGVVGLAKGKKMFCMSSSGSDYGEGTAMHHMDFLQPYLRTIFGFIGITDIQFVQAQPMDYDPSLAEIKLEEAKDKAISLAQTVVKSTSN